MSEKNPHTNTFGILLDVVIGDINDLFCRDINDPDFMWFVELEALQKKYITMRKGLK